jgi:hypothetical protein
MPLPVLTLATGSVEVGGQPVAITSLSRSASVELGVIVAADGDGEAFIVSKGTGVSVEEASAWLDTVDNQAATDLIRAILQISALVDRDSPNP